MRNSILLISFVFFTIANFQHTVAQQVDIQSKIEYSEEQSGVDDLNSITVPAKKMKKVKEEKGISIADLQRVVKKRKSARYRKVRAEAEKCFKDTEEEGNCEEKDLEKALPKEKEKE